MVRANAWHQKINIRIILLSSLYFTRVYNSVKRKVKLIPQHEYQNSTHHEKQSQRSSKHKSVIPDMIPLAKWYERFSTSYMVYILLRPAIKWLINYLELDTNRPIHCYLLGKFFVIPGKPANEMLPSLVALCHLVWRHRMSNKDLDLGVLPFLLMSEKLIHSCRYKSRTDDEEVMKDESELYLRDIMFYKMISGSKVTLLKRANRCINSRYALIASVRKIFFLYAIPIILIVIFVGPFYFKNLINDLNYLNRYSGCNIELEMARQRGELSAWSASFTGHESIAFLVDIIENILLYTDTAGSLATLMIADLINNDLMIYWQSINDRLADYLAQRRQELVRQSVAYYFDMTDYYSSKENFDVQQRRGMIFSIQTEIRDFFQQLRIADKFISDTLSMSVIFWISTLSIYILSILKIYENQTEVRVSQVVVCSAITVQIILLLKLHRRLMKTYITICSIMALDRSKFKTGFIKVLEFYTDTSNTSYSFMNGLPFMTTTFLSIAGWSFSFVIVAETYLH